MNQRDIQNLSEYLERQASTYSNNTLFHLECELRCKDHSPATAAEQRRQADIATEQGLLFMRWSAALKELIAKNVEAE